MKKTLIQHGTPLVIKGVNIRDLCGRNTSNGRIYVNAGYHTWLIKNEGHRINGKFARLSA
jgi:hypothetical protein